eukprot:gene7422-9124_t
MDINFSKEKFEEDGFIILDSILDKEQAEALRLRVKPLFNGDFSTGVFPDEWWGRPSVSLPDITKEIVNCWKSDYSFAEIVLSEKLGKLVSELMGWEGARVAQDDIFWKGCKAKPLGFHQDHPYMDFFDRSETATIWIALTDCSEEVGTLEYAKSSHKWNYKCLMSEQFHAPQNYKAPLQEAAAAEGINNPETVYVNVLKGGGSIHHGKTWHGSSNNTSEFNERISLAIHYVPSDCKFKETGVGYIYGRYKLCGSTKMEESFFPITYTKSGYRSPCIDSFCHRK